MNVNSQSEKEKVAKEKFELGTGAFTHDLFSDAVNLYRESGKIYDELGIKRDAFMAFYQALMARRKQYPRFLKKKGEDFLRPEYLQELEEFVSNFSEFEHGEKSLYKERYLKTKYGYLKAKGFKYQQENKYESESRALWELANFVETHPDIFPGEHYQVENVFRWRMMAEQAKVRLLRAKGSSLGFLAEEYKRIADMNEPPAGSTSRFLEEVRAQKANFCATSFKFSAFSELARRRPTISDVKAAMEFMKQALDQAKNAKVLFDKVDKEKGLSYAENLRYLSYWHNIFLLRVSAYEKKFNKAIEALEAALSDVRYYKDSNREEDIFPNYYADFDDLQNETLIISASKALVIDRDTQKSGDFLKIWIDRSREKHHGSWRFNNVYIRYLVISIFTLLPALKDYFQECNDKLKIIDEILKHEFVGSTTRKLATIAKDIVKFVDGGIIEINDGLHGAFFYKICDLFPIESTTLDFRIIESHRELLDPFQFLPEYFSKCFKKPENLNKLSLVQMQNMYQDLIEGIRYYFLIITEFHYKRYLAFKQQGLPILGALPDNFECTFSEMKINKLKAALGEICKALHKEGRRFKKFQIAFSEVEDLLQYITQSVATVETLEKSFQVISEKIIPKTFMSFFPHVVQVTESYEAEKTKVYKVRRIWEKVTPEELNLFGPDLVLEKGAYYYLTPRWKRYGRASVDTRVSQFAIFKSDWYSITIEKALTNYQSNLKQKLLNCPPGPESWQDYEEICIEILKFLFVPPLMPPDIQSRTETGLLRRDALFPNWVEKGFWATIGDRYNANFIHFEFKNTEKLKPVHVDQVDKYLRLGKDTIGRFGVILSRKQPTPPAFKTRKVWFTTNQAVILFLDDHHLVQALNLKEAGHDPVEVLRTEYEEFLKSYEP
ncbi:MAG: hypothetical protein IIA61_06135 [Candidatus Marinimicrobia bacterium]|nr:hypothetical protein [Candidatus Neomarinimicrobiota bacterium]